MRYKIEFGIRRQKCQPYCEIEAENIAGAAQMASDLLAFVEFTVELEPGETSTVRSRDVTGFRVARVAGGLRRV